MLNKEKKELGTKLGDLNAVLADLNEKCNLAEARVAFKLCNDLYTKYVKYDMSK